MDRVKAVLNLVKAVFTGMWGITVMDLIPVLNVDILSSVDGFIKTAMAAAGFVYFIVNMVIGIPHKIATQKEDRKIKKLNRELKEKELEKLNRESKTE